MFKNFQDTSRSQQFSGFPNLNFQMNNEAYGFSGCTFWLDAAYGLNTQTDLAAVSRWVDRVRNIPFEQATAGNQPRLQAADVNFNNFPSVDFNSNARRLQAGQTFGMPMAVTIVIIGNRDSANTRNTALASSTTNNNEITFGGTQVGVTGIGVYNAASPVITSSIEDTAPHIALISSGTGDAEIVVDCVSQVTGTWLPAVSYDSIGQSPSVGTATGFIGKIAEIIIFNNKLSSVDMIRLSGNINSKYAIY